MSGAMGRVNRWLDHCAELGKALMQPSRAFPGFVIRYTILQGSSKCYCTCLGGCYLIIGRPGQGNWQYIGEEEHGPHPTPESSYPLQQEVRGLAGAMEIANGWEVTRRLRAMSEQIA